MIKRYNQIRTTKKYGTHTPRQSGWKGRANAYVADWDTELEPDFFLNKGKFKKSSGKGMGRSGTNPRGKDGKILECHSCGSTEHLVAEYPKPRTHNLVLNASSSSASSTPVPKSEPPTMAPVLTTVAHGPTTPAPQRDADPAIARPAPPPPRGDPRFMMQAYPAGELAALQQSVLC